MNIEALDRVLESISNTASSVREVAIEARNEYTRPSVMYKPTISVDGNQWCVLYGPDLQNGVAGFGDSPAMAMEDFDRNWYSSGLLSSDKQPDEGVQS